MSCLSTCFDIYQLEGGSDLCSSQASWPHVSCVQCYDPPLAFLQVVLTNGTVVDATPTTNSDLLWALKVRGQCLHLVCTGACTGCCLLATFSCLLLRVVVCQLGAGG